MGFPLYDDNPFRNPTMPYVTWGLIALNGALFLVMLGALIEQQTEVVLGYAVVPAQLSGIFAFYTVGWPEVTLLTGLFLHAGWQHVLGNMVHLWVFGDDIEELLGPLGFQPFYMLAGIAATLVYVAFNARSTVPLVGASGAISGVLAAYLMLRPCAKVTILHPADRGAGARLLGDWRLGAAASPRYEGQYPGRGRLYIAHFGGWRPVRSCFWPCDHRG